MIAKKAADQSAAAPEPTYLDLRRLFAEAFQVADEESAAAHAPADSLEMAAHHLAFFLVGLAQDRYRVGKQIDAGAHDAIVAAAVGAARGAAVEMAAHLFEGAKERAS